MLQLLRGADAFSGVVEKVVGWSHEEVQILVAQVKKDAKKKVVYMLFDL
jgi:hypothetical protein